MYDRRKSPRWPISRQARIKLEGKTCQADCRIQDINFSGMQVVLAVKLAVSRYVKFQLALSPEFTLRAEAWVAWHREVEGRDLYGLYFTKLTQDQQDGIYQFVFNRLPEKFAEGGGEMEDHRIFQRFNARFPARLLDLTNGNEISAETRDVSAKGIGLALQEDLPANTPLEAWIEVPDQGEPIYARGLAVWSRQDPGSGYRIGMDLERADLMGLSRILRV